MSLLETIRSAVWKLLNQHYEYAVVYGGSEGTEIIYEEETRVYINGWGKTKNSTHFSPNTVHHAEDRSFR